jgi:hypothetical protein
MTMDEGFLRLSRKAFRSDLWREERELSRFEAWLDLIASCSFTPEDTLVEGRSLSLLRGELVASVRYLGVRWRWSKSKVDRFIVMLKEQDRITVRHDKGLNILRLVKYDQYNAVGQSVGQPPGQGLPREKPPAVGQSRDTERDSRGTVAGQSRDKDKELKKERNIPSSQPMAEGDQEGHLFALKPQKPTNGHAKPLPPEEPPPDPRHRQIMSQWGERFMAHFGYPCTMDGGRDAKGLQRFLKGYKGTAEEFLAIAAAAWGIQADKFAKATKLAITVMGLCSSFEAIRAEITNITAHANGQFKQPPLKSRACGDLNKPGRYS